jgi:RNA polymerase sigma-70 factor (ECF subfamily)
VSIPDWTAIHASMRPRVRFVARSVLLDEHEAEDAVQDTFLRAIRGINTLREPAAVSGWLLTLARRAALDRCRRLQRLPQVSESDLDDAPDAREAPPCDAIELAEAFSRLTRKQQRALNHDVRGRTIEQAAIRERISVPAAKTRLCRARAALRRMVLS